MAVTLEQIVQTAREKRLMFSSEEPRIPAGSAGGGQWTKGGDAIGSGGGKEDFTKTDSGIVHNTTNGMIENTPNGPRISYKITEGPSAGTQLTNGQPTVLANGERGVHFKEAQVRLKGRPELQELVDKYREADQLHHEEGLNRFKSVVSSHTSKKIGIKGNLPLSETHRMLSSGDDK